MRALARVVLAVTAQTAVAQEPVRLYAAGSLRAAMTEMADRNGGVL
jgi:ABC-type molybdate transport system substrate-binding protein